ncbi:MAG: TrkA family potassium uptake protein [Candidatus Omnitrophota bacterium]|nr:MAG: TrkA family potassium uptake protein [Candidatus Omnitrophota bacterium]
MRQFAVIGLGRFGLSVARTLAEKGYQVLAIDIKESITQDVSDEVTQAVCLDATDEKALRGVGIENVDVAVIGVGTNLEASILITLNLKEIGVKEIVCKAVNKDHKKALKKIGATKVIQPEKEMGVRVANSLVSSSVIEHIELSDESSIVELIAPKQFIGKSLREVDVRAKFGVTVIAVKRRIPSVSKGEEEEIVNVSPQAEDIIKKGDILVVLGPNENIDKLKKKH